MAEVKIFIVNGQGGVGKGEFVNYIKDYNKVYNNKKIASTSIIDYVKEIAKVAKWQGTKSTKDRKFLHDLKILCENYNDLPYSVIENIVKECQEENVAYLFIDMREPRDIKRFQDEHECSTVLIERGAKQDYGNDADNNVFDYHYDYIIENKGTIDDFYVEIEHFWDDIILSEMHQNT